MKMSTIQCSSVSSVNTLLKVDEEFPAEIAIATRDDNMLSSAPQIGPNML